MKSKRGDSVTNKNVTQKNTQKSDKGGLSFLKILSNIGGGFVAAIFVMLLFQSVEGYDWLMNTMLANNLKTIEQYPDLNLQQRYEAKWGGEIGYTFRIKNQTPDSAIILLPPRKLLTEVGLKGSTELPHMTYFLYPRKVVFADNSTSSLIKKADYIVCVNGWGLDKVSTVVTKPEAFMILPTAKEKL